jgi:hypothetical protein
LPKKAREVSPRELFRTIGLKPLNSKQTTEGRCGCGEVTTLYKKGSGYACDICIVLSQAYLNPPPKAPSRLVDGSYLLITQKQIDFWGNQRLGELNPSIRCHSATGAMREVKKRLINKPPEPPWMWISFTKAPLTADGLYVTEDNARLRFSGKTTLVDRNEVREVNRTQVMRMAAIRMTEKEWRTYMMAYAAQTTAAFATMQEIEAKHPELRSLQWLPPLDSPEHSALRLLTSPKG